MFSNLAHDGAGVDAGVVVPAATGCGGGWWGWYLHRGIRVLREGAHNGWVVPNEVAAAGETTGAIQTNLPRGGMGMWVRLVCWGKHTKSGVAWKDTK